jgi:L-serine dehydratase
MRAAAAFAARLADGGRLGATRRIVVELYGSLALTGRGHGTDRAVMLGLEGRAPDRTDPDVAAERVAAIRAGGSLELNGTRPLAFAEATDLLFLSGRTLPRHSNAMRVRAFDDAVLHDEEIYYSVGGGFIETAGTPRDAAGTSPAQPFPFASAAELLALAASHDLAIWEIILANECALRSETDIRVYVDTIWNAMQRCVERGLVTEGHSAGWFERAPPRAAALSQAARARRRGGSRRDGLRQRRRVGGQ